MRSLMMAIAMLASLSICVPAIAKDEFADRAAVLKQIERGNIEKAVRIAEQLTWPQVLVGMRVDNRFTPVVDALPTVFDMDRAIGADIAKERAESEEKPRSLEETIGYTNTLITALRYKEAFDVLSPIVTKLAAGGDSKSTYNNLGLHMPWLLNQYSDALKGLGQWDEAAKFLAVAARMNEGRGANVSQVINLGLMYAKMGRTAEALKTIETVGEQSPYGATQVALVKLIVAEQTDDQGTVTTKLEFLRNNQRDSMNTYQIALVEANRLDDAAVFLISRLRDPKLRNEALCEAQDYDQYYSSLARAPARVKLRAERWQIVLKRPDVQEEIRKVGKIEKVNLRSPI